MIPIVSPLITQRYQNQSRAFIQQALGTGIQILGSREKGHLFFQPGRTCSMIDVVAMGELLIDFTPGGTNSKGMKMFIQNPGGAPANVLAMNARKGVVDDALDGLALYLICFEAQHTKDRRQRRRTNSHAHLGQPDVLLQVCGGQ